MSIAARSRICPLGKQAGAGLCPGRLAGKPRGDHISATVFRGADAPKAYERAIKLGARPVHGKVGPIELDIIRRSKGSAAAEE
jgi:hypothetical protein